MSTCYYCRSEIPSGSNFCIECGRAVPPPEPAPPVRVPAPGNPGEGMGFIAKNLGRVAAIFVVIGFVLPWTVSPRVERGYDIACYLLGAFLWIVPIGAIASFLLSITKTISFQQTKIAAAGMLIAGIVNVLAMIYFYVRFVIPDHCGVVFFETVCYTVTLLHGAYMSFIGSVVLGLAGGLHLRSVHAFRSAAPQATFNAYESPRSYRL